MAARRPRRTPEPHLGPAADEAAPAGASGNPGRSAGAAAPSARADKGGFAGARPGREGGLTETSHSSHVSGCQAVSRDPPTLPGSPCSLEVGVVLTFGPSALVGTGD